MTRGAGDAARSDLVLCGAGAGTGKTFSLCEFLTEAIVGDGVDPARIVATTFTRRAATELKDRIERRILADERLPFDRRIELTERLDLAAIGTVHGVAHRLISRYALHLGLSPNLRVVEETSVEVELDRLLGQMPPEPWDELAARTARLEGKDPRQLALKLLTLQRSNGITDAELVEQLREGTERMIALLHGEAEVVAVDAQPDPFDTLARHVTEAIAALYRVWDDGDYTVRAYQSLSRLAASKIRSWGAFAEAAALKGDYRSGSDRALEPLRAYARSSRRFAALHDDLRGFTEQLATQVLAIGGFYADHKRERGLVDFTDLEVLLLQLLERADLAEHLASDFSLVTVDEFQDTNPIQLAIFIALRRVATRSFWVGDAKQTIYGFRGSDADLMSGVWDRTEGAERRRLGTCYRSVSRLVGVLDMVFEPVFGAEALLAPGRIEDKGEIVAERWLLRDAKSYEDDAAAIAAGVVQLRDEGIPLGGIALLVRSNFFGALLGEALAAAGVPSALPLAGLLSTREGALALAGLRLVADPWDSLAAATIRHLLDDSTDETPPWLAERLDATREARDAGRSASIPWAQDPALRGLKAVDPAVAAPSAALAAVMDSLGLSDRLASWGEPERRAAHLDELVDKARGYETQAIDSGASATIAGLIAYFEQLAERADDTLPVPPGLDAVQVSTYHAAKGLEWDVVVLTQLNAQFRARHHEARVAGGRPEIGLPLDGRRVVFWPWPYGYTTGRNTWRRFFKPVDRDVSASAEAVETERREYAESQRLLYVGFTRAKERVVLAHRPGETRWLDSLGSVDRVLPVTRAQERLPVSGVHAWYRVRDLDPEDAQAPAAEAVTARWLAPASGVAAHLRRDHSPSDHPAPGADVVVTAHLLPGERPFPADLSESERIARGSALHAYFAALPSLGALDRRAHLEVAARCIEGFSLSGSLDPGATVIAGERLQAWLEDRWPGATARAEVPVAAPRSRGGRWNGIIDLLVEVEPAAVAIVDHKVSVIVDPAGWGAVASRYAGQLEAYAQAVTHFGLTVESLWLHLPVAGVMLEVSIGG